MGITEVRTSTGTSAGVGFNEGVATTLGLGGGGTISFRTDAAEALDGAGTMGAVGGASFGCSSAGTGTGGISGTLGEALIVVPSGTPPSSMATSCPPGSLSAGGGSTLWTWVATPARPRLRGGSGSSIMGGSRGRSLGPSEAGRLVVARSEGNSLSGLPGVGAGWGSGAGRGAAGSGPGPVALAGSGGSGRIAGGGEAVTGRARGAGFRESSGASLEAGT